MTTHTAPPSTATSGFWPSCYIWPCMAEIYRAVFTCPELDERTVWYVSNRRAADIMLSRHIRTEASTNIASKYKRVEYTMTIEPVFTGTADAGYDPRN